MVNEYFSEQKGPTYRYYIASLPEEESKSVATHCLLSLKKIDVSELKKLSLVYVTSVKGEPIFALTEELASVIRPQLV